MDTRTREIMLGQSANLALKYLMESPAEKLDMSWDENFKSITKLFYKLLNELHEEVIVGIVAAEEKKPMRLGM